MIKKSNLIFYLSLLLSCSLHAEITSDQINRLGNDLTPLGGERAGNADGSIPEWTGGLTEPPSGFKQGEHYIDPFENDPVLFTITGIILHF